MRERRLKKINDEQWKEIPGSDRKYYISNYGRIRSFFLDEKNGKILKPVSIKGFMSVNLKIDGKAKTYYVHKLTAEVFVPKTANEQIVVTHCDGNAQNNYFKNLQWQTKEEHFQHVTQKLKEINLGRKGRVINSKLQPNDIAVLKAMLEKGVKQNVIAKLFSISEMQVSRIKRGENWGDILPATNF